VATQPMSIIGYPHSSRAAPSSLAAMNTKTASSQCPSLELNRTRIDCVDISKHPSGLTYHGDSQSQLPPLTVMPTGPARCGRQKPGITNRQRTVRRHHGITGDARSTVSDCPIRPSTSLYCMNAPPRGLLEVLLLTVSFFSAIQIASVEGQYMTFSRSFCSKSQGAYVSSHMLATLASPRWLVNEYAHHMASSRSFCSAIRIHSPSSSSNAMLILPAMSPAPSPCGRRSSAYTRPSCAKRSSYENPWPHSVSRWLQSEALDAMAVTAAMATLMVHGNITFALAFPSLNGDNLFVMTLNG
jgi:hypothetical protein